MPEIVPIHQNAYSHQDHEDVASCVGVLRGPWIVTYDAAPQIRALYQRFPCVRYDLNYSAQARYRGREVMFFSCRLIQPRVPTPASVPSEFVDRARTESRHRT
jgi:DNA adenine methylase